MKQCRLFRVMKMVMMATYAVSIIVSLIKFTTITRMVIVMGNNDIASDDTNGLGGDIDIDGDIDNQV